MLRRYTGLTRTGRLPPVSKKQAKQKREQGKAYATATDADQEECCCCRRVRPLQHSHLLTQGNHKQHRNNPLNWLMKCGECHSLFEHQKARFARTFPAIWQLIQERILLVGGPQALAFFQLKNSFQPLSFPSP